MSQPVTYHEALEAGVMALRQGDSGDAVAHFKRAVALAGDSAQAADALAMLGRAHGTIGEHAEAEEALSEALRRAATSPAALARTKMQMGVVRWQAGQLDAAKYFLQDAEQELKRQGDTRNRSMALGNLGMILLTRGEYQEAIDAMRASIELCEQQGDKVGVSVQSSNLGEAYYELGDLAGAQVLFERAIQLAEELESESMQADAIRNLGMTLAAQGELSAGRSAVTRALALAEAYHQQDIALQCQASLAELELLAGEFDAAQATATRLQQLSSDVPVRIAQARLVIGRCQLARREAQRALMTLEAGLVDAQVSASKMLVLRLHAALAQIPGHVAIATVHRRIAVEMAREIAGSLKDPGLKEKFVGSPLYKSIKG